MMSARIGRLGRGRRRPRAAEQDPQVAGGRVQANPVKSGARLRPGFRDPRPDPGGRTSVRVASNPGSKSKAILGC